MQNHNKLGAGRGNKAPEGTKYVPLNATVPPMMKSEVEAWGLAQGLNLSGALRKIIPAGIKALAEEKTTKDNRHRRPLI